MMQPAPGPAAPVAAWQRPPAPPASPLPCTQTSQGRRVGHTCVRRRVWRGGFLPAQPARLECDIAGVPAGRGHRAIAARLRCPVGPGWSRPGVQTAPDRVAVKTATPSGTGSTARRQWQRRFRWWQRRGSWPELRAPKPPGPVRRLLACGPAPPPPAASCAAGLRRKSRPSWRAS